METKGGKPRNPDGTGSGRRETKDDKPRNDDGTGSNKREKRAGDKP